MSWISTFRNHRRFFFFLLFINLLFSCSNPHLIEKDQPLGKVIGTEPIGPDPTDPPTDPTDPPTDPTDPPTDPTDPPTDPTDPPTDPTDPPTDPTDPPTDPTDPPTDPTDPPSSDKSFSVKGKKVSKRHVKNIKLPLLSLFFPVRGPKIRNDFLNPNLSDLPFVNNRQVLVAFNLKKFLRWKKKKYIKDVILKTDIYTHGLAPYMTELLCLPKSKICSGRYKSKTKKIPNYHKHLYLNPCFWEIPKSRNMKSDYFHHFLLRNQDPIERRHFIVRDAELSLKDLYNLSETQLNRMIIKGRELFKGKYFLMSVSTNSSLVNPSLKIIYKKK